jgi:predicted nucleic acid-binding protein
MVAVADTSPVNYLILIQEINILQKLYEKVALPPAVYAELLHPSADRKVRAWIAHPPPWMEVRATERKIVELSETLDPGERDAIALAGELGADALIIDDRQGRVAAAQRGIPVIGTLGVLRVAASNGLVDLRSAVERLRSTNFYVAPEVLERLLEREL